MWTSPDLVHLLPGGENAATGTDRSVGSKPTGEFTNVQRRTQKGALMGTKKKKSPGLKGDLETLIQFAKDQGWDEEDVSVATRRLEVALSDEKIKFTDR